MSSEPGTQSRVMFQASDKTEDPAHRKLGKLTVKYNRKDLQRRLDIEEWIDGQLHLLFDCEPLFGYLPHSELWIWSAGLSMQLIKFSRREDRVKGNPLVQTRHFSPDKWRIVWLSIMSVEDVEDVYTIGCLITGFLLFGVGGYLAY
ncbi:hypothetical protein ATANTOWER_020047 [Ataeniobius toweri]|uniref:Protein phosphatase 1 regulatory subunit 14B n=1 Tax=Ataeniobius toweri TaxID=208326 RepID=A0ABU7CI91_9TELE|nr:hypothetical protein [Ataeniobius toweri]